MWHLFITVVMNVLKNYRTEIHNPATKILAFKADATSLDQAEATVQEAIEKLGGVDILINNAGITRDNLLLKND